MAPPPVTELLREKDAIERDACAASLATFVRRGWPVLEPGTPYVHGKVIDAICAHLEAVTAGEITRLLITVPPGMCKSLLVSSFWPAFEWGPKGLAHHRFLSFSYSDRLSTRDNRRTRLLVTSPWFQRLWPLALADDEALKTRFENERRGWRMASSVGGVGTGERADRLVIDDPHAVADANSPAMLERAGLWWRETLPTRLNSPERSAIVVIMQRVHEKDIAGSILARERGWEVLCLPMEHEPERACVTFGGRFRDWRTREGQLLFPERFPAEVVRELKATLGSYATAAQLQQRPAPRGGGMLKVEAMPVVEDWPRDAASLRRWDFASTEARPGADPDWTAGVRLAWKDGRCWVVDVRRERLSPRGVELLVRATAERDGPGVPVLLEQEPGSSGVSVLDHYRRQVLAGYAAYASRVTGSKLQRAEPFAAAAEAGNVLLVRGAWNDAFIDECRTFPAGAHDDQVDAAADGFSWLARKVRQDTGVGAAPIGTEAPPLPSYLPPRTTFDPGEMGILV